MSLLSTLQTDARMFVTEIADTNALSDANLLTMLNYAAREFIRRAEANPTSITFNATISVSTYLLSTVSPLFASVHKDGLWYYNGTIWRQMDSETQASLSQKFPTWKSAANGTPFRYFIEGGNLVVHPPPASTTVNGFTLFYFAKSKDGTASQQVFTASATELTYLVDFEDILFDYVRAKAAAMLNKPTLATDWMNIFYARCEEARGKLAYRADLIRSYKPYRAGWAVQRSREMLSRSAGA